jgi:hypothetical protein
MKMYEIIFRDDNSPLYHEVDFSNHTNINMHNVDGKRLVKSITLFATNEDEAIKEATGIAECIFSAQKDF